MTKAPWTLTRELFLSVDETDRLLAFVRRRDAEAAEPEKAASFVDRVIIESLLMSGLRCSEFCRLQLADAPPKLASPAFEVRGGEESNRTVWLPRPVADLLTEYVRDVRPALAERGCSALIVNERGRPYERTGLYRRVVAILTAADLAAKAKVQLLRHTYGYLAYLRSGGNLLFVQRQLGHAHPMITSVYAQFVEEDYGHLADTIFAASGRIAPKPPARRIAKKIKSQRIRTAKEK
ncbi:MAG: site-specific integrase [Phycisphaerales bacterium]|nr:site-specific integrase [Phycisphaerales bacterium]